MIENPKKKSTRLWLILITFCLVLSCIGFVIDRVQYVFEQAGALPTRTAIPTKTENSFGLTYTARALPTSTPTITFTPTITRTPTITPTPLSPAELTRTVVAATATEIAKYIEIDWRELSTYPDNHKNELVKVRIQVFNVVSGDTLQGYFYGTYDAIIVQMSEPLSGVYENDVITAYGLVYGKQCGTNALGGEICQPMLIEAFYTK
ncbi:MAG: hypothetical protein HY867_06315 [Chloroflexi bacterium]|nr:hypothetical protein [Chloroflexota bacterium]